MMWEAYQAVVDDDEDKDDTSSKEGSTKGTAKSPLTTTPKDD